LEPRHGTRGKNLSPPAAHFMSGEIKVSGRSPAYLPLEEQKTQITLCSTKDKGGAVAQGSMALRSLDSDGLIRVKAGKKRCLVFTHPSTRCNRLDDVSRGGSVSMPRAAIGAFDWADAGPISYGMPAGKKTSLFSCRRAER